MCLFYIVRSVGVCKGAHVEGTMFQVAALDTSIIMMGGAPVERWLPTHLPDVLPISVARTSGSQIAQYMP